MVAYAEAKHPGQVEMLDEPRSAPTPGPWVVVRSGTDPRIAHVFTADHGRCIADVWNAPGTKGEQALSDGRLIASAPALLAALKALYDRTGMEYWPVEQETARAAIAEALGDGA